MDGLESHTDLEDRLKYRISTAGQMREQTIINESGLYSLILSSKLPSAKHVDKEGKRTEIVNISQLSQNATAFYR